VLIGAPARKAWIEEGRKGERGVSYIGPALPIVISGADEPINPGTMPHQRPNAL
jgi:hypothetical protein